jgi:hypothetical protein
MILGIWLHFGYSREIKLLNPDELKCPISLMFSKRIQVSWDLKANMWRNIDQKAFYSLIDQ